MAFPEWMDAGSLLASLQGLLVITVLGVAGAVGRKRRNEGEHAPADGFTEMFDNAPVPMFVLGMDGSIAYVNGAGMELLGGAVPEEVLGRNAIDFLIAEERDDARANLRKLGRGEVKKKLERTLVRLDGTKRNVEVYQQPIRLEGEPAVQSILIDVTERESAYQALESALSLFRSTVEATTDGILVTGLDQSIVAYNEHFVEMWRLKPETLEAGALGAIFEAVKGHLEEPEAYRAHTQSLYACPDEERGDVIVFKDGRVFERFSRPQRIGNRIIGRVCSFRDVTERERSSRALRASEEKFSKAFRGSPVTITISRMADGMLIDANPGFEHLTGYTREEAIGKTTGELRIWEHDDRSRIFDILEREGRLKNIEATLRTKNGELRTCLVSSEVIELEGEACLIGITYDVTEKKRAEAALRASQEKFKRAFRSSPDSITITRLRDGRLIEVNEGFERITGFPREEAVGRTAASLGLWPEGERERMLEALRASRRVRDLPLQFRIRSGEVLDFLFSAEIFEWEGEPCLVGIARDMTDMVRVTRERERLIRELEAQNAELERFTYTVSHDLKSPLVTIKNFLGFLEQDVSAGDLEKTRRDIGHIASAADRMGRLLEELLHLSRTGRVLEKTEHISLNTSAEEALTLLAGEMAEVDVVVDVQPEMPEVLCDPERMVEVFQNLIGNAVRFRRPGLPVRIEVGAKSTGEGEVLCWVRDDGVGIEPKYHEKVFGLFERLGVHAEGTGIGLALVKRIVEGHGGRVWVASEGAGAGSTFFFTLPESAE